MMENFVYYGPTKLLFGRGQLDCLPQEILPYGKRILLVYGEAHLKKYGVYDRITALLKGAGIEWVDFGGVHPNPRLDFVSKGIETCRQERIEFVLAVGGGTSLDAAKAIAAGVKADFDIWQAYADFRRPVPDSEKKILQDALPLGAVITKSATGSEFDLTSVLTRWEEPTHEKLILMNPVFYPKFSICDPTLAFTLPADQTAYGIADMMTHYLEQYFGPSAETDFLDRMKEGALKTIISRGPRAIEDPEDYAARADLMYAAAWSCSAQTITGVIPEWTSHFIEHELTAMTDLNHGLGMALIYPAWMRYVAQGNPAKFAQYAERVWDVARRGRPELEVALEGIEKTAQFWASLGIAKTLTEAGIPKALFPKAAKQAARFGPMGTAREIRENDVLTILEMAS